MKLRAAVDTAVDAEGSHLLLYNYSTYQYIYSRISWCIVYARGFSNAAKLVTRTY